MDPEMPPIVTTQVIPEDRLPPGFARTLENPPDPPAVPRPAATVVLLRDGDAGPEALLLQRHRSSGFVPGAYVFPGGRVDAADADPRLLGRARGLADAPEPAAPYWFAAVREVFEETGVLLARDAAGRPAPDAAGEPRLARWRERLLDDDATLLELLEAEALAVDLHEIVYCAHWITPLAEPRRYDTRFFLAAMPPDREERLDPREMTDALWLTPEEALRRFRDGRLPMVFPTVKMLESLAGHGSVSRTLAAFRGRPVTTVLPRLVRTAGGIGIVVDD
ncbi:MAG: NUDIX domain-containing protein [Gemmatimonadetes bacterium]|nr:NUDIX domain-containing protein [Gemmatimonadota bacterium]